MTINKYLLQLSFTNTDCVPSTLRRLPNEKLNGLMQRQGPTTGKQIVESIHNDVTLEAFHEEMCAAGFTLEDACWQVRLDKRRDNKTYAMVRFVYVRVEDAPEVDPKVMDDWVEAQRLLTEKAMWKVRGYRNPSPAAAPGEEDACFVSVNADWREPLCYPNGDPITRWAKDEQGKRMGTEKIPIEAVHFVRLDEALLPVVKRIKESVSA